MIRIFPENYGPFGTFTDWLWAFWNNLPLLISVLIVCYIAYLFGLSRGNKELEKELRQARRIIRKQREELEDARRTQTAAWEKEPEAKRPEHF